MAMREEKLLEKNKEIAKRLHIYIFATIIVDSYIYYC